MYEAIYAFFNGTGLLAARFVIYFVLVGLILGFFGVFIVRAIKERFSSSKNAKDKPDSERTTEIVTVDLD